MGDVLEPHYFVRNRLKLNRREAKKLSFISSYINKSGLSQITSPAECVAASLSEVSGLKKNASASSFVSMAR